MICPDTAFPRSSCTCGECERIRDEASELRKRKAHVLLADKPERERDRELLHLDGHLRELVRELT